MPTIAEVQDMIHAVGMAQTVSVSETIRISSMDHLDLAGRQLQSSADPVFHVKGEHWSVRNGKLTAQAGSLFNIEASNAGIMANLFATGWLRRKELFRCVGESQCYDTHIIGGEWQKPQSMLSPIIYVDVNGPYFNSNSIAKLRFQTNGLAQAPCVLLRCSHSANWIYGNAIQDINFEIPNGGAIHLESCFGTNISNCYIFDADLFGNITNHLIHLSKSPTGLNSKFTTITNYFRLSGIQNPGVFDILATNHYPDSLFLSSIGGIEGAKLTVRLPVGVRLNPVTGATEVPKAVTRKATH